VLVSAGSDLSGDTTQIMEMSDWIGMGCLDTDVMGIYECCIRYQAMNVFFRGEFFIMWS
jgi:hypothetical protein